MIGNTKQKSESLYRKYYIEQWGETPEETQERCEKNSIWVDSGFFGSKSPSDENK